MKGVLPGRRFQSIADDGFDPARIEITKTVSLLDHICGKERYLHWRDIYNHSLRDIYNHSLWRILQDRRWNEHLHEAMLQEAFKTIGLAVLDVVDAAHAEELGLEWPDHFSRGEFEYEPVLLALDHPNVAASLATLDGMLGLVLLYRSSLDVGRIEFAKQIHAALERACRAFGNRWQGEAADTWSYVAKTRVLAWMPNFAPSHDALRAAKNALLEEFEKTERKGHGRASLAPDQVTRGKVERRWRRRALMRASAGAGPHQLYVGFQTRCDFNAWLTGNRQLIKKHLEKKAYLYYVGEGEYPEYEAEFANLAPLEIPADVNHPNSPP
jgi:hypothetical protein